MVTQHPPTPVWIDQFPGLSRLSGAPREALLSRAVMIRRRAGVVVFGPDLLTDSMLFLTEGVVRVRRVSSGGREIVLYRVIAGESCVMTSACVLSYQQRAAEVAETDVAAAALPQTVFDDLMANAPEFRAFVLQAYARRMSELFAIVEEVAFDRIDSRLARRLLALADDGGVARVTHADLAADLGTAREVVSRVLRTFQQRGWVLGRRGEIAVLDGAALAATAATAGAGDE